MKIIAIDNRGVEDSKRIVFSIRPDSSIIIKNRPVYLPKHLGAITVEPSLVIPIGKLGRSISPKFAHRYYSEIGLGVLFRAKELEREAIKRGDSTDIANCFDNSTAKSSFIPFEADREYNGTIEINGELAYSFSTKSTPHTFEEIISGTSKYMTMKTGDLIYSGSAQPPTDISIGTKICGYLNGEKLLDFTIK